MEVLTIAPPQKGRLVLEWRLPAFWVMLCVTAMTVGPLTTKRTTRYSPLGLGVADQPRHDPARSQPAAGHFGARLAATLTSFLLVSIGWLGQAKALPGSPTNAMIEATPPGFAGSRSCQECHEKFYQLWSTSFHGLAMQPYTPELAKTKLTPQTDEIVAGKYRFLADLQKGGGHRTQAPRARSATRSCR